MALRRGSIIMPGQFHFVVHEVRDNKGEEVALVTSFSNAARPAEEGKWYRTKALPQTEIAWIDLDKKRGKKDE
jgi:hypothetical protein